MNNFQIQEEAAPNARIGELTVSGKTIGTPSYFANLTRKTDPQTVVDAVKELNSRNQSEVKNIGGFIVESQLAPVVLGDEPQYAQADLNGAKSMTDLRSIIERLGKCLIVEPNTDRLLYSQYRENINAISGYLPDEFLTAAKKLDLDSENGGMDYEDVHPDLQESVQRSSLAENLLSLQAENGADLLLSPYYPIDIDTFRQNLEENIELFKISERLSDRIYDKPVAAVIPLRKSVLGAEPEQENGRRIPPQEWLEIIDEYKDIESDLVFIKATNVETDPDKLHKTDSEGISSFSASSVAFRILQHFSSD